MNAESKYTILVVDDDPDYRESTRRLLHILNESFPHQVLEAGDGAQAMQIVAEKEVDCVLLDHHMPGGSGVEWIARILKADSRLAIVMVTGQGDEKTAVQAMKSGAVDYLVKGAISAEALQRVIMNAAKLQAAEAERQRLENINREQLVQLAEQNSELKRAAEFREEVEAIARHDLKSPLNLIIGAPQILLDMSDNLTEKQRHYLEMIESAGRRMLDMINLSLDLFQIEHGMYEFRPKAVDAVEVVREVVRHQEPLARVKEVTCALLIAGRQPAEGDTFVLPCERLLLYSSLSNLLKNAIEASPSGETVTIDLRSDDDNRSITIRNRGAVPPPIRERFFRKHTTSGKEHGVGLGAYSAKLMIEAQNGSIQLDSSQPDATTVLLRFQQCAEATRDRCGNTPLKD